MKTQTIAIGLLENNTGQIEGLPQNPRFVKDARYKALVKSIKDFPLMLDYRELVVVANGEKYVVIGGNMRLKACQQLKYKELTCKVFEAETDPAILREFAIKDNVAFGSDDHDILANEWEAGELVEWGFELPVWEGEAKEVEEHEGGAPSDNIQVDVVLGDLIEIGRHRLVCGDSTTVESVDRVMNGQKADMVFTDPPYGIDWNTNYTRFSTSKSKHTLKNHLKVKGDAFEFDPVFWLANYEKCLFFGANCFSDKLPKGNWIVWDKRYENGTAFLADAEVAWYNGSGAVYIVKETSQGFVNSDGEKHHPTQKPVALFSKIFEKIKAPQKLLDPFGGSGTTMVACEQLDRTCYMIELEPKYCQVIINRMAKAFPSLAIKINGVEYHG